MEHGIGTNVPRTLFFAAEGGSDGAERVLEGAAGKVLSVGAGDILFNSFFRWA